MPTNVMELYLAFLDVDTYVSQEAIAQALALLKIRGWNLIESNDLDKRIGDAYDRGYAQALDDESGW